MTHVWICLINTFKRWKLLAHPSLFYLHILFNLHGSLVSLHVTSRSCETYFSRKCRCLKSTPRMNIKGLIATVIAPVYLRLHEGCDPSLHPYRSAGIYVPGCGITTRGSRAARRVRHVAQITGWDSRAQRCACFPWRGKNQPPGKLSACSRDDNTPVHVRASLRRFRTSLVA